MPSNERPEISFIVVSWNTRDLLRACLAGVRREAMGLIHEILIYVAAVMAFPTTLVKKGIGVALGAPILYAINVLRIGFLMAVGRYFPYQFDFMHLYFWQATLILMITSVWLLWIFQVVRREGPALPA